MGRTRNADYERIADNISSKQQGFKLYLIAAEGDKTEAQYFQAIEDLFKDKDISNVHVEFIDRTEADANKSDPKYVQQTLIDLEKQLEIKGYQITEKDELWFIVDVDEYNNRIKHLNDLEKACNSKAYYYMALSNPCFEVWLILHFTEETIFNDFFENLVFKKRPKKCKQTLNTLRTSEHKAYTDLFHLTPIASERAKKLQKCTLNEQHLEQHACTDVYKLLDKLYALFNLEEAG